MWLLDDSFPRSGKANQVLEKGKRYDWKVLSERHVWDLKHKVVLFLHYFNMAFFSLAQFNKYVDPQDNSKFLYWKIVEKKRTKLRFKNSVRAYRKFDENWRETDKCLCNVCEKDYYNPKDACYCCYGMKPYLPFSEVDTIGVA